MKRILKTIWTYISAFTVNLKKTAEAVNRAGTAEELENDLRDACK